MTVGLKNLGDASTRGWTRLAMCAFVSTEYDVTDRQTDVVG